MLALDALVACLPYWERHEHQGVAGKGHKPGYLDAVCVDVSARRQGVGAELVAAARSFAQQIGAHRDVSPAPGLPWPM